MANFTSSIAVLQDLEVQGGCITFTNTATDIDLIDNNASALSFDASGKTGILEFDTTNCSEGVTMSGTLKVTGLTTIGSCGGTCGMGPNGLRIDGTDGQTSLLVSDGCVVFRDCGVADGWQVSNKLDVDGTADFDVTDFDVASSGDIDLTSTNNAACAIYIRANGGTSETIKLHADQGTSVTEGAASVSLISDAGGVELRSTANLVNAINITSDGGTTGTISIFNDQGTAVNEGVASVQLLSDVGGIGIKSGLNAAGAIRLTADAGTSETIILHADQGNGVGSISLVSDVGGITLNPATFMTLGGNSTNAGEMRIFEDTSNGCNYVALKAPNVSTSYTITLPTAVAGASCYVLTSTNAGVTSWAAAASGGASLAIVIALS